MKHRLNAMALALAGVLTLASQTGTDAWQSAFPVDKNTLGIKGSNPYFILTPGYQLSYKHGNDTVTDTVLNETKVVDGVETRVVEDRETKNGRLIELTRDYYAIDSVTNDVYYMGEDVDVYKNGKIVSHEGSWLSGVNGAKFGLMMPGTPLLKGRYHQEIAAGAALDRAEIVSLKETVVTPAGTFMNCLKTEETSSLEPGVKEYKLYAPGIGFIADDTLRLVEHGFVKKK